MTPEELAELERQRQEREAGQNFNRQLPVQQNTGPDAQQQRAAEAEAQADAARRAGVDSDRQRSADAADAQSGLTVEGRKNSARESLDSSISDGLGNRIAGPAPTLPGVAAPPPDSTGNNGSTAPDDNTGFGEGSLEDVNSADPANAALNRALQLILAGDPVSQADLDRQRESANQRTARELADQKARAGAGGFGVSFAADAAASDIARIGQRETDISIAEAAKLGRQEQLNNILQGSQLGRQSNAENRAAEEQALINALIEQQLNEGKVADGEGSGEFGSSLNTNDLSPEMAALTKQARADAAEFELAPFDAVAKGLLGALPGADNEYNNVRIVTPGDDLSQYTFYDVITTQSGKTYALYANGDDTVKVEI